MSGTLVFAENPLPHFLYMHLPSCLIILFKEVFCFNGGMKLFNSFVLHHKADHEVCIIIQHIYSSTTFSVSRFLLRKTKLLSLVSRKFQGDHPAAAGKDGPHVFRSLFQELQNLSCCCFFFFLCVHIQGAHHPSALHKCIIKGVRASSAET